MLSDLARTVDAVRMVTSDDTVSTDMAEEDDTMEDIEMSFSCESALEDISIPSMCIGVGSLWLEECVYEQPANHCVMCEVSLCLVPVIPFDGIGSVRTSIMVPTESRSIALCMCS